MTTRRTRRVTAQPLPPEERSYTEDDYATPEPEGLSHGEVSYAEQMDWIPATVWTESTPDAFAPDEEEPAALDWGAEPENDGYAPFRMDGYEPLFQASPAADDEEGDADPLDEDLLTEEEQEALRRSRWQLLANLADLAGVIFGTVAILLLIALLISLLNWLVSDMSQSFILLQKHL